MRSVDKNLGIISHRRIPPHHISTPGAPLHAAGLYRKVQHNLLISICTLALSALILSRQHCLLWNKFASFALVEPMLAEK